MTYNLMRDEEGIMSKTALVDYADVLMWRTKEIQEWSDLDSPSEISFV